MSEHSGKQGWDTAHELTDFECGGQLLICATRDCMPGVIQSIPSHKAEAFKHWEVHLNIDYNSRLAKRTTQ